MKLKEQLHDLVHMHDLMIKARREYNEARGAYEAYSGDLQAQLRELGVLEERSFVVENKIVTLKHPDHTNTPPWRISERAYYAEFGDDSAE